MGLPMSKNLVSKGFELVVLDKSEAAMQAVQKAGEGKVQLAKTPAQVVNSAKIVITMLPANQHIEQVYLGKDGLLEGSNATGAVLVDSSTIDPNLARKIHTLGKEKKAITVDAPVSGGT